jgi:hypothetical protein
MSPDEPSLSDHEQRILAEIERNLKAEDPDFVRQVSEAKPAAKSSARLFQLSLFGLLVGIALLAGYFTNLGVGVLGFLVMLASVIGIVTSVKNLAAVGRSPSSLFRDALRRAEERMRSRRPPEG